MNQHLEAYSVHKIGEKQSIWTRLGNAFRNNENNIVLKLYALPASIDGQYQIVLLPPKTKDKSKQ